LAAPCRADTLAFYTHSSTHSITKRQQRLRLGTEITKRLTTKNYTEVKHTAAAMRGIEVKPDAKAPGDRVAWIPYRQYGRVRVFEAQG
jgi:hypothetical protein